MKNYSTLIIMIVLIAFSSGIASAGDNVSNKEGLITLTDTGTGPGIEDIALSTTTFVRYNSLDGTSMQSYAVSSKSQAKIQLAFVVAASDGSDTNRIFQKEQATAITALPDAIPSISEWHIRGGQGTAAKEEKTK